MFDSGSSVGVGYCIIGRKVHHEQRGSCYNPTAKVDHLVVLPQHWADDVFDKNYPLLSIKELEENIHKNNHLPGIPSAKQVQDQGVSVGEMQSKLLRKVEELTLYIIEQNKRLNEQEKEI